MKKKIEWLAVHHEYTIFFVALIVLMCIWLGGYVFDWAILPMALLMKIPMGIITVSIIGGFTWIWMNVVPKLKRYIDPDSYDENELTKWEKIKLAFWFYALFFAGGLYAVSLF